MRPANVELRHAAHKADEDLPVCWLVCEWPSTADEPVKYWLFRGVPRLRRLHAARNGKGDAYAYCKACHPGATQRHWTRERVLDSMRAWQAGYGRLPSSYG